ncbi:alpha/beta hydrolase [Burkholderia ubonensis]|uniref:alpha/beta hydrolase n=1 Tax=Burkholderia ubonensis TaxID=101571 RepID=UPI0009B3B9F4|nr:alpha/beta hydrolase [Burkholderia ubonensis]
MSTPSTMSADAQPPLPSQAAIDYERTVLSWSTDIPPDVVAIRDLRYGPDPQHRYDVFGADRLKNAPILVFWHGGGWTNGYKEYVSFLASAVVRIGMVLVAPTYRLAPRHRLPAAFDDAAALLAHLAGAARRWGGNPDRLYLAGHSAGGAIAAMAALRAPSLRAAGGSPTAVRGCLPISGVMDLCHPSPLPGSLEERVYTMLLDRPDSDAAMSALCWAATSAVPMVLSYGQNDSERVIRSNRRMHALLAHADPRGLLRCDEHPGEDHFQTHTALRDPSHPWFATLGRLVEETSK